MPFNFGANEMDMKLWKSSFFLVGGVRVSLSGHESKAEL